MLNNTYCSLKVFVFDRRSCPGLGAKKKNRSGLVAQWIRRRPTEPGIAGSSPAEVTPNNAGSQKALKARNVRNENKNNHFSFVAIAHWPFRLGLAAAASDFALMWMGGPTARRIVVLLSFVALLRKIKSMCSAKIFIALMPGIHHSPHGGKLKTISKFRKYASTSFPAFGAAQHSLQNLLRFRPLSGCGFPEDRRPSPQ